MIEGRPQRIVIGLILVVSGCLGAPAGSPTATPTRSDTALSSTATPTAEPVSLPDGPKDRPARPESLTEASVREYVQTMEYRWVYNSLWRGPDTDVHVTCEIEGVEVQDEGYEVVVSCNGYADIDPPENSTATPGPHYDYSTQVYLYVVTEETTRRRFVKER